MFDSAVENLRRPLSIGARGEKGRALSPARKNENRIWFVSFTGKPKLSNSRGRFVITKIQVVQKKRSADLLISLGSKATQSDVYFDQGTGNLTVDVYHNGTRGGGAGPGSGAGGPRLRLPRFVRRRFRTVLRRAFAVPKPTPRVYPAPATYAQV